MMTSSLSATIAMMSSCMIYALACTEHMQAQGLQNTVYHDCVYISIYKSVMSESLIQIGSESDQNGCASGSSIQTLEQSSYSFLFLFLFFFL